MKNPNTCTIHTGNITVLANVFRQLSHEGDTEAANFVVTLALRVEVGSTLTSTHVKSGESILEDLLKAKELENGQVDRRVQTQTALVRTQGRVELDAETAVDLDLALVVLPDDAELDDALGDRHDPQRRPVLGVLLEQRAVLEGDDELCCAARVRM